jgi:lysozyme
MSKNDIYNMKHIKKYNFYLEEQRVNEIISYVELSINESRDIKTIWNNTISKLKNLSKESKKKVLKYTIYSLLAFNTVVNVSHIINSSPVDQETKEISNELLQDISSEDTEEDREIEEIEYKKGHEWKLSQDGWDHIREEEGLRLKAYKIGDGMITVGYGHAEPIKNSQFKVGETITKQKAEDLLKADLKTAADGVRRMFKEWEQEGIEIPITQGMFDALVSIAYNAGVGGLRRSDVVDKLKNGEYEKAGNSILNFKINKKFPGLAKRRQKESEMFLASL